MFVHQKLPFKVSIPEKIVRVRLNAVTDVLQPQVIRLLKSCNMVANKITKNKERDVLTIAAEILSPERFLSGGSHSSLASCRIM